MQSATREFPKMLDNSLLIWYTIITEREVRKMKNAIWIPLYTTSILGMIFNGGLIWLVLSNLFSGYGMNWLALAVWLFFFFLFSQLNNWLTEEKV